MTRTKPCTTSVTCFSINNLCSVYSGRNTFAWGSARTVRSSSTPKGVDGQHESKNYMLSTGRKTAKFPRELAISDSGCLDTSGSERVLHRVHKHALPVTYTSRNAYLCRDAITSDGGNKRFIGKGCDRGGSTWPRQLYFPAVSGREERGWIQTGGEPERAKPVHQGRALQDGRAPSSSFPNTTGRLDGEAGLEGCLPSGSNSSTLPPLPTVPMAGKHISIQMSPVWPLSSTSCIHKAAEASSWSAPSSRNQTDHLSGRFTYPSPVQGSAGSSGDTDMPAVRGPGPHDKQKEIPPITSSKLGVFGLPGVLKHHEVCDPEGETSEDTAGRALPPTAVHGVREGAGEIRRENVRHGEGDPYSPIALQSHTKVDELSVSINPLPSGYDREIQCAGPALARGKGRPSLVGGASLGGNGCENSVSSTKPGFGIRCLQHGLGSHQWEGQNRGSVVLGRNNPPYKLPRIAGNIPGSQDLREGPEPVHHSLQVRQCHSRDVPEPERRSPFRNAMQFSTRDLGMVPVSGNNSCSGASPWAGQCDGRPGVEVNSRPLRLDVEPPGLSSYTTADGTTRARPVCVSTYSTLTPVLQLASGPRSGGDRRLHSELGSQQGLCQPTLVSNQPLSDPGGAAGGKDSDANALVEHSAVVSGHSRNGGGLPSTSTKQVGPGHPSSRPGVYNAPRSSTLDRMAHLRNSFTSQGLSGQASELLLTSWRTKTNQNYNSLCNKWFSWCQPRDRNPFDGPVADVVNFLAELHTQGYQYRSLNSYRSAISSIHGKVDGYPIGQHPLVNRALKGAYHSRPPQPRYNTFWDVSIVLHYIRDLGSNESLSLHKLTLKTVMLLALTRPSRSMDLSSLDIRMRSFTKDGVIFRPIHLSKQSRASKPIEDFFFPEFSQDVCLCPVAALRAYESQTLPFRNMETDSPQTRLFLSLIGKHTPVTSSTIARWLRTCLLEAGIDTSVFKAHSVRGASSSTAAWAGVSTADILKAADWSSEGTFQTFYHRKESSSARTNFGVSVLASAATSNLHVDIETEPSEM